MIVACLADMLTFRVDIFLLELSITGGDSPQLNQLVRLLILLQVHPCNTKPVSGPPLVLAS